MAESVLLVSAASAAVVAVAYGYLSVHLWRNRRPDDPQASLALQLFAAWWGLTGVNHLIGGVVNVAAAFGHTDVTVVTTYLVVQRLLLAVALASLMGYLVYLFAGRLALRALAVLYLGFYAYLLWGIFQRDPDGVLVTRWRTDLHYAGALPAWEPLVTFLLLVGPPLVGCVLYLRLLARVPGRSQRVRILVVSLGMVLWWVVAVLAGNPRTFDHDAVQLSNRVFSALVAVAILLAFEPTPWMQRRFALEPYSAAPARS